AFTQDVNRAQVLKTGSIVRQTVPFILGKGSAKAALDEMQAHDRSRMHVVDRHGQPIGVLLVETLERAVQSGVEEVESVMNTDFPIVEAATSLEEIFHIAQSGMPIAVVNRKGKFKGVVEQSDILASIGRLSQDSDEPKSPSLERVAV
ncbi:MAG: CBS domain-containing protein, partial [Cyanobacteria bacterium J06626_18]